MALIVASAFLPWLELSIRRLPTAQFSPISSGDYYYGIWHLRTSALFPFLVWFPLPFLIGILLQQWRGKPHMGRVGVLLLCLGGALSAFIFLVLTEFLSGFVEIGHLTVSVHETLLLGVWTCEAGYGLLVVGALLFVTPLRSVRPQEARRLTS